MAVPSGSCDYASWNDGRQSFSDFRGAGRGQEGGDLRNNAQTKTTTIHPVCPRCRSAETDILTRSPVKDVWIVHGCKVCLYAWRNTEPEENINPDKYPEPFRLDPVEVDNFIVVPTIPPLRKSEAG